ncbi:DUF6904 family protein [Desulfosporosinus shakirovi]|uniref:DUF6904 family protein n=1 Tax=Desulfosporosinus shakirovi TaxID=2885154 RepID=UPI001E34514C|nr:hypothetical protein [Desulfosporosinus sp. SRJS8]MCB8818349.1 hypothetical protein [Desulfosporosinus sp. SRJS8]
MLKVSATENLAGVTISGDQSDFETLYDSLHEIVGDEEDHPYHEGARLRVLGVCYDLRHALMGDREIIMIKDYAWLENYITQYLDVLKCKILGYGQG